MPNQRHSRELLLLEITLNQQQLLAVPLALHSGEQNEGWQGLVLSQLASLCMETAWLSSTFYCTSSGPFPPSTATHKSSKVAGSSKEFPVLVTSLTWWEEARGGRPKEWQVLLDWAVSLQKKATQFSSTSFPMLVALFARQVVAGGTGTGSRLCYAGQLPCKEKHPGLAAPLPPCLACLT